MRMLVQGPQLFSWLRGGRTELGLRSLRDLGPVVLVKGPNFFKPQLFSSGKWL